MEKNFTKKPKIEGEGYFLLFPSYKLKKRTRKNIENEAYSVPAKLDLFHLFVPGPQIASHTAADTGRNRTNGLHRWIALLLKYILSCFRDQGSIQIF